MTHPGLAVMLVVGVGLGAVLYYFFASSPETGAGMGQTNRRSRNSNHTDSNRTYSTSPPNSRRNRREDRSCMICLEDTDNRELRENAVRIVPCMHVFHKICIEKWRINGAGDARQLCPICRDRILDLEQL